MTQKSNKKPHLTAKQTKGIQALLSMDTMGEAAEKAGITRKTLWRWLRNDFFVNELNQAKRQLVQHSILKLQQATRDAVKTLNSICKDKKASPAARVSAAREILNNTLKSIELEDIEERIKALEKRYLKSGPGRK